MRRPLWSHLAEQFEEYCDVDGILRTLPRVPAGWTLAPYDVETAPTAVVVYTVRITVPVGRISCTTAVIVPVDFSGRDLIGHGDQMIVVAPLPEVGHRSAGG